MKSPAVLVGAINSGKEVERKKERTFVKASNQSHVKVLPSSVLNKQYELF